jgi:hypothetical protein
MPRSRMPTPIKVGMVRVVDESGDDYLDPRDFFSEIQLSPALAKALAVAP